MSEFGLRGEWAVGRVVDDLVDGFGGFGFGVGLREVDAGGLETVEKDSGAARVELACGEVLKDETDG